MDLRCKHSPKLGVAITGATGFIGSRLVDVFGAGDFEATAFENIGTGAVVVHLAADVSPTREAMLANIAADTYLLEIVNQKHKGLVYASSNNVYPYALDCRINEFTRCNDYYSVSKILCEKLVSEWAKVPSVSVRIADVFGVGQRHGNFFKAIEQSVRMGKPLKQYGQGLKRRTYIHVQELCEMLKFIALNHLPHAQPGLVFNLGYEDSASIAEILGMVSSMTSLEVIKNSLEGDRPWFDVRTMQTSILHPYVPRWGSFCEALAAYVDQIKSEK
jgi:nucleoside-diphosphate-sugar epimerase